MAKVPAKKPSKASATRSPALDADDGEQPSLEEARKPPPLRSLSSIVGQGRAATMLQDALESGRFHHAWIFEGPAGVGKATTAISFASLLLDPTLSRGLSGELHADEDSPVRQLIRANTHPDLAYITKSLTKFVNDSKVRERKQTVLGVDIIRDFVLTPGRLAPMSPTSRTSAAGRVFVIDEAEDLNDQAQNAILKFLEEPPPRVVLMLVCSSPHLLLPTIRSRCQRVAFAPLSRGALDHWLRDAHAEGGVLCTLPEPQGEDREFLLGFAEGSPGMLTQALQAGLLDWWRQLAPLLRQASSGRHAPRLGATMHTLVDGWATAHAKAHPMQSKESANATASGWLFRLIAFVLRKRLNLQIGVDATTEPPALAEIDALQRAQEMLERNVNMQFAFEAFSADLAGANARASR